jgi:hypothetical protein
MKRRSSEKLDAWKIKQENGETYFTTILCNPALNVMYVMNLFFMARQLLVGQGLLVIGSSRSCSIGHTALGWTPLEERSARRRALYLTTYNTHKRHTSMPPVGLKPAIPGSELPQTHALDRAATGIGYEFREER